MGFLASLKKKPGDYEKGMVAGAKPFEDKYAQISAALNRVADKTQQGMDKFAYIIDGVLDKQHSDEIEKLFHLYTPYDLKNLEDHEKSLLLGGLFTLAQNESNENQKSFIRSVKSYLDIKNPQTEIDFSAIENIENLTTQKIIFQVYCEFLFLENEDMSFLADAGELLDLFSIKQKDMETILTNIIQVYNATGTQGLCEKYGYVPISDENALPEAAEPVVLEKLEINSIFHIAAGHTHTFTAKEITLNADIHCEGSLVFDRCAITYNGYGLKGQIRLERNTSVSFTHCTIIGKNNQQRTEHQNKYLVQGNSDGKLSIENTIFNDCIFFASGYEASLNNCKILYSGLPLFREYSKFITADRRSDSSSKMENCLIECNETPDFSQDDYYLSLFDYIRNITNCTFKNIPHDVITGGDTIKNCHFSFCKGIVDNASTITDRIDRDCFHV